MGSLNPFTYSLHQFKAMIPKSATVKEVDLDSVQVRQIEYQTGPYTQRLWISPSEGWNVVRREWIEPGKGRATLKCKIGQFDQVWFPRELVYEHFDKADKLTTRNVARIRATFNRPIEPDRFELSSLNLPEGTTFRNVLNPSAGSEPQWRK